jgi:hypothetical protein
MSQDEFRKGDNNVICDVCGFKLKASQLRKRWDGLMVCEKDWESRHPQDYVRGRRDNQTPSIVRSEPDDKFLTANEVTVDDL